MLRRRSPRPGAPGASRRPDPQADNALGVRVAENRRHRQRDLLEAAPRRWQTAALRSRSARHAARGRRTAVRQQDRGSTAGRTHRRSAARRVDGAPRARCHSDSDRCGPRASSGVGGLLVHAHAGSARRAPRRSSTIGTDSRLPPARHENRLPIDGSRQERGHRPSRCNPRCDASAPISTSSQRIDRRTAGGRVDSRRPIRDAAPRSPRASRDVAEIVGDRSDVEERAAFETSPAMLPGCSAIRRSYSPPIELATSPAADRVERLRLDDLYADEVKRARGRRPGRTKPVTRDVVVDEKTAVAEEFAVRRERERDQRARRTMRRSRSSTSTSVSVSPFTMRNVEASISGSARRGPPALPSTRGCSHE